MTNSLYSVVFTRTAEGDLNDIYGYNMNISHIMHVEIAFTKLVVKLKEKIMQLREFPFSCPLVLQVLPHKEYRKLLVDNYLVFYRVDRAAKMVYIARILHGSRNYLALLNDEGVDE